MRRRVWTMIVLCFLLLCTTAYAEDYGVAMLSDDGVLTITGDLDNLNSVPWNNDKLQIKRVVFSDGNQTEALMQYAFKNCTNLVSVSLPDGLKTIGYAAFEECSSLEEILIPQSVKTIEQFAFKKSGLKSITLGENLESVANYVFENTPLTNVEINGGADVIGGAAFKDCIHITDLTIGNDIQTIRKLPHGSLKDSLENVVLGDGVTQIPDGFFENHTKLISVELTESIKEIGGFAFKNCPNLQSVSLGGNLNSIGEYAFQGCNKLNTVEIPSSVTKLGVSVFNECKNTVIFAQKTKTALYSQSQIHKDAFAGRTVYYYSDVEAKLTGLALTGGTEYTDKAYEAVLTPMQRYALPEQIEITVNGEPLDEDDYTYNPDTGKIEIHQSTAEKIVITAVGIRLPDVVDGSDLPKTGDGSRLWLWTALLCAAGAVLAIRRHAEN